MADSPVDLSQMFAAGAVYCGADVASVRIVLTDGREVRLELPSRKSIAALQPTPRRILDVLRESETPMTRKAVAKAIDLESATGRFGSHVAKMIEDGLVFEGSDGITDDALKLS